MMLETKMWAKAMFVVASGMSLLVGSLSWQSKETYVSKWTHVYISPWFLLFENNSSFCVCVCVCVYICILFIHSSVNRHLRCFQFVAIMSNAARTLVCIFLCRLTVLLFVYFILLFPCHSVLYIVLIIDTITIHICGVQFKTVILIKSRWLVLINISLFLSLPLCLEPSSSFLLVLEKYIMCCEL